MPKTLYIIDGHSQIYRAYHARAGDFTSPTGEPTRAPFVFCNMLLKFLADRKPDYLAMAIDGPAEKLHRRALFADYKITRRVMPDDFHTQADRVIQIVRAMGIPVLAREGFEADDVLTTAARRLAGPDLTVYLVSRDKDLDQLVNPHVLLYDPTKDQVIDADAIRSEKGYPPDKAIEAQVLTGDTSDNIPGIPGVGPKTAARLIEQYGSADELVRHVDELKPKLAESVRQWAPQLELARKLVTLDDDVPIELDLEAMRYRGIDGQAVRPLFAELGFNRLLDQLDKLGVGGTDSVDIQAIAAASQQTTAQDFDYRCVNTPQALDALAAEIRSAAPAALSVDTETDSVRPMQAELVGISLAWKAGTGVYIPVRGPLGATVLGVDLVHQKIGPLLADERIEKIGQNLKYDLTVLKNAGFVLAGPAFDTMIAAHVLDATRLTYKLDALAAEFLNHRCIPIEDVIGRGRNQISMATAPVEAVAVYSAEDAEVAFRLADALKPLLDREGLRPLMTDLEMPLMPVLAGMEQAGIRVDPDRLRAMESRLSKKADELREKILDSAGEPFNPDSPRQLATILFERLHLPPVKKTKTGLSTDSDVLEELSLQHELPALVLDYRKLTKLLGTYLTALRNYIHPRTGRIHTSFHQIGAETGRLSSSDPNLQNIPIRTEEGRQIRSAFVADPGCLLLSADYSQVELRVLAHFCQDETLTAAFHADQDIHRIVAAEVFGVKVDEVTPEQRARAKTVNFGIIYGQTAFGLAVTLRIGRAEAADFIQRYRSRFPQIQAFLDDCVRAAKDQGYVETIFKRRRRINEIDSRNPQKRALAERLAINSVVQGSAADLIKQAMLNIARRIERENRPARMLLQIHDELVLEVPHEHAEAEREMVRSEMASAIQLSVPLKVDTALGENWMEAK